MITIGRYTDFSIGNITYVAAVGYFSGRAEPKREDTILICGGTILGGIRQ